MSELQDDVFVPDSLRASVEIDDRDSDAEIDVDQWLDYALNRIIDAINKDAPEHRRQRVIEKNTIAINKIRRLAKQGQTKVRKNRAAIKQDAAALLRALADSIEKEASK